ncbi:hypothetical protein GCM10027167_47030 [Nocardia heshunensis]
MAKTEKPATAHGAKRQRRSRNVLLNDLPLRGREVAARAAAVANGSDLVVGTEHTAQPRRAATCNRHDSGPQACALDQSSPRHPGMLLAGIHTGCT